jgi:hypothetical protein
MRARAGWVYGQKAPGFCLRRRGEGVEVEIAAPAAGGEGGVEDIFRGEDHIVVGSFAHQHLFQLARRGAALRGVRFICDDRVGSLFEAGAVFDCFKYERESLNGDDDDGLRVLQRAGELLRFRAFPSRLLIRPTTPSACSN